MKHRCSRRCKLRISNYYRIRSMIQTNIVRRWDGVGNRLRVGGLQRILDILARIGCRAFLLCELDGFRASSKWIMRAVSFGELCWQASMDSGYKHEARWRMLSATFFHIFFDDTQITQVGIGILFSVESTS